MEVLDIVNEKDEVIGKAPRNEVYDKLLTHRIVHVIVFNAKNEMALQLRGKNVAFCPLHWDSTAAGHVRAGETYEEAARRELLEEAGKDLELKMMFKEIYTYEGPLRKGLKKVLGVFRADYDGFFEIDVKAVKKIEFFSLKKIQDMIDNGEKMHPELLFLLRKHYGIK